MIISPHLDGKGMTKVYDADDKVIIQHVSDNTAIAERAKFLRENTDRGFSPDRQYQCLGFVPMDAFFKEGLHKRPMADLVKYLESDDMAPYRVTKGNTGKSGKVIVK